MKRSARQRWSRAFVALACGVVLGAFVAMYLLEEKLRASGRPDLVVPFRDPSSLVFMSAILGASAVGAFLALRRPAHPAGWLFLAFGASIGLSGAAGSYAMYGVIVEPGSLPGAWLVAVYADGSFLAWVFLLTLILLITPTGSVPAPRWRYLGWISALSAVVFFVALPFRSTPLDWTGLEGIVSPYAFEATDAVAKTAAFIALVVSHLALLGAAGSLVYRARHATPEERRSLRWMLVPAIPFPVLVFGAWWAAYMNHYNLLAVLGGGYLVIIPVAAGLAIERARLYDIDRILSRTASYTLLTGILVGCYAAVVIFVSTSLGNFRGDSQVTAVIATLVTVSVALPVRRQIQDALDRRFNRRQFEAVASIRRYTREPSPSITVEAAMQEALGAESLSIAYWVEERQGWVTGDGVTVEPGVAAIMLQRHEAPVAAITCPAANVERATIAVVANEAHAEIENARLRAAIALQLVEVRESRARIVAAQLAERRRIERNLHDGAQQRLLALALQLRAAEVSKDPDRAAVAIHSGVDQLQEAVRELRELANGLRPATLSDGGLAAALDDLAARTPVPVRHEATRERFAPAVEETAWFIVCEAVANAVKHATPQSIVITACREADRLRMSIADDGCGGADPAGHGLRGIADRAEAAGGWLRVENGAARGTTVRAELPCAP